MNNINRTFTGVLLALCSTAIMGCQDQFISQHFSLLEGDNKYHRVIAYCANRSGGQCGGGIYVVPSYNRHFDSTGRFAEYVDKFEANKNWVIATTIQIRDKKVNYWIVEDFNLQDYDCDGARCDSIVKSYVLGPFDQTDFKQKISELKVGLDFR